MARNVQVKIYFGLILSEALSDVATIDKPSKAEGRSLVMFLSAKKA